MALVLMLVVAGCAGETNVAYPELSSTRETTIVLIDQGQEPRRSLQIRPQLGVKQLVRVESLQRGRNTVGGQPGVDTGDIATQSDLSITPITTDDQGITLVNVVYDASGADPDVDMKSEVVDNIAKTAEPVVGRTLRVQVAPNGTAVQASFDIDQNVSESEAAYLRQVADQVATYQSAFPEAPVGLGARWSAALPLTINGISVTTTTTYTVKQIDDSGVQLDLSITQTPNGERFDVNSQTVDVVGWDVGGTGSMTIRFDRAFAIESKVSLAGKQTLKFGGLIDSVVVNTIDSQQSVIQLDSPS
jgi:hypothetical protein